MSSVDYEVQLYEPMSIWLEEQLIDTHQKERCEIYATDCHAYNLDKVLTKYGVIDEFPQVVGLDIEIDVLGIVKKASGPTELHFIEAKKTQLNLHHLGQLWAYCKLCNPTSAYLLSPKGLGSLNKVLVNLRREDLLDFGSGRKIKKMTVAKWDIDRNTIDNHSRVPKI